MSFLDGITKLVHFFTHIFIIICTGGRNVVLSSHSIWTASTEGIVDPSQPMTLDLVQGAKLFLAFFQGWWQGWTWPSVMSVIPIICLYGGRIVMTSVSSIIRLKRYKYPGNVPIWMTCSQKWYIPGIDSKHMEAYDYDLVSDHWRNLCYELMDVVIEVPLDDIVLGRVWRSDWRTNILWDISGSHWEHTSGKKCCTKCLASLWKIKWLKRKFYALNTVNTMCFTHLVWRKMFVALGSGFWQYHTRLDQNWNSGHTPQCR